MTITEVRAAYRDLRDRARVLHSADLAYVDDLWAIWDATLANLADVGDEEGTPYFEFLTRTIRDPRLSDDVVLEWLDAYPSGIHDRWPVGQAIPPRP